MVREHVRQGGGHIYMILCSQLAPRMAANERNISKYPPGEDVEETPQRLVPNDEPDLHTLVVQVWRLAGVVADDSTPQQERALS